LELNRPTGLLLDDHRASSDFLPYDKVADFDLQPRNLLSIAKSKSALSRRRRSRSRNKRIAHICRGFRGRFVPTFLPAFHAPRSEAVRS
ncbi:MAG: hypothetical protein J0H31_13590, partial [Alphaproteobacteria bacterium]|nr:hypothetical protein [Alphaproteobacteria bacterium]